MKGFAGLVGLYRQRDLIFREHMKCTLLLKKCRQAGHQWKDHFKLRPSIYEPDTYLPVWQHTKCQRCGRVER